MNKREYHLTFCKFCHNSVFSENEGLLCGITNRIADFDKDCDSMDLDTSKLERVKHRVTNQLKEEYDDHEVAHFFNNTKFKWSDEIKSTKFKNAEKTHGIKIGRDKSHDKAGIIILSFCFLITLFFNFKNDVTWDITSAETIVTLVLFLTIPIQVYIAYFRKYSIELEITEYGLIYKDDYIYWNEILAFGLQYAHGKGPTDVNLIIGTANGEIKEISITYKNIKPRDFVKIVKLNTSKYLK